MLGFFVSWSGGRAVLQRAAASLKASRAPHPSGTPPHASLVVGTRRNRRVGGNAAKKNAPLDGSYELVRLVDVEDRERASPRSALRHAAGASCTTKHKAATS